MSITQGFLKQALFREDRDFGEKTDTGYKNLSGPQADGGKLRGPARRGLRQSFNGKGINPWKKRLTRRDTPSLSPGPGASLEDAGGVHRVKTHGC